MELTVASLEKQAVYWLPAKRKMDNQGITQIE